MTTHSYLVSPARLSHSPFGGGGQEGDNVVQVVIITVALYNTHLVNYIAATTYCIVSNPKSSIVS